jgi:hypothetical protein
VRQVILIVLLIGAAFLGGAFVNGPGLQWVQSRVLRSLGLTNGGEIAAVDLESTSNCSSHVLPSVQVPSHQCRQSPRKTSPPKRMR